MPTTTNTLRRRTKAEEVALVLRREIRNGQWPVGARLPGLRHLAKEMASSVSTVQGALQQLEGEGYLECVPRSPAKVLTRAPEQKGHGIQGLGRTIGIAVRPDIQTASRWFDQIFMSCKRSLIEQGYEVRVIPGPFEDYESVHEAVQRFEQFVESIDGLIFFANRHFAAMFDRLEKLARHIPWISIRQVDETIDRNFIASENFGAMRALGRLFARAGYERTLFIHHSATFQIASQMSMLMGYTQGWVEVHQRLDGLELCAAQTEGSGLEQGRERMQERLVRGDMPGVVITTGDDLAVGALRALQEAGVSIPGQVRVMGTAGLVESSHTDPPLTVLGQPVEAYGQRAVEQLSRMIEEGRSSCSPIYLPPQMHWRASCPLPEGFEDQFESDWQRLVHKRPHVVDDEVGAKLEMAFA